MRPSRPRPGGRSGPATVVALLRRRIRQGGRRTGPPVRLTGIGTGLLTVAGTLAIGGVDRLMFGNLGLLFGLGFVFVCFQASVRVRLADLPAAPISGPIAFAAALTLLTPTPMPGLVGRVLALCSGLALRAGWLFGGTGLAVLIVGARFVAQRRIRRNRA